MHVDVTIVPQVCEMKVHAPWNWVSVALTTMDFLSLMRLPICRNSCAVSTWHLLAMYKLWILSEPVHRRCWKPRVMWLNTVVKKSLIRWTIDKHCQIYPNEAIDSTRADSALSCTNLSSRAAPARDSADDTSCKWVPCGGLLDDCLLQCFATTFATHVMTFLQYSISRNSFGPWALLWGPKTPVTQLG